MELNRGSMSRRGFIQRSIAGMAATGIPLWSAREVVADYEEEQAQQQPAAANDTIVMGHIGCGNPMNGRGRDIGNAAARVPGVQYVACADVNRTNRQSWANIAAIRGNRTIAMFEDFRELLARRDINAVTIATVDHWHALAAIAAMRAGKDVYCEKPLSLTIEEGKAMVRVARQTNRRLQVGSQQRIEFGGRFRTAVELVRNGRIGNLRTIECRIDGNPRQGPFPVTNPPDGLNWDFWKGPTPDVQYVVRKCDYEFRWWYEYSGGKMTDWGAHHLDIAQWALNADDTGPVTVERISATTPWNPDPLSYNCHPAFRVRFTYANGVTVDSTSEGRNGITFTGENGRSITVSRDALTASHPEIINEPMPANAIRLPRHTSHMQNFINCVRSRQQPMTNVEIGHRSVTVCHLGNIAVRSGQRFTWDPVNERITSNEAMNTQWVGRPMRAPWRLDA
ncbi:MAG TPA: Gfo/Idh/MocA family oxidoreductase [Gemmataceae bacterium]|nr:Gfo/Idh/MocA family oxidoreductase [Gemmataceae bacterium]